jgi:hypothetical protein
MSRGITKPTGLTHHTSSLILLYLTTTRAAGADQRNPRRWFRHSPESASPLADTGGTAASTPPTARAPAPPAPTAKRPKTLDPGDKSYNKQRSGSDA